jgi:hypothetical protein
LDPSDPDCHSIFPTGRNLIEEDAQRQRFVRGSQ